MRDFPYDADLLFRKNGLELIVDKGIYHNALNVIVKKKQGSGKKIKKSILKEDPKILINSLSDGDIVDIKISVGGVVRKHLYRDLLFSVAVRPQSPLRVQGAGSGRSGTQSLAHYLCGMHFEDGEAVVAKHESVATTILKLILASNRSELNEISISYAHNVEIAPYFWLEPSMLTGEMILHIIRDGRDVVASGMERGWYRRDSIWDKVKPEYPGDGFSKACQLWANCNAFLAGRADVLARLEDLAASQESRESMLKSLNIQINKKDFPISNQAKGEIRGYHNWSTAEKTTFEDICGQQMDKFYPGWSKDF
jgi:hypothetical protein